MDTEPAKLPPLGVIVGVATANATAALKLSTNDVVRITPPPPALTVTGKLPPTADPLVLTVNTVVQLGLQEARENVPTAPEGSPETENEIGCTVPEANVAVMALITEVPAVKDMLPEFVIEKSNGRVPESVNSHCLG
jgi:hypothetical protein